MFSYAGAGLDRLPSRARAHEPGVNGAQHLGAGVPQHRRHSRRRLAGGLTTKEIGALVHLSAHTNRDRLEKIAAVFDVRSRLAHVHAAHQGAAIPPPPRSSI